MWNEPCDCSRLDSMKKIQCQALNGCDFLLNQQYWKQAVGGSNCISAVELLCLINSVPLHICQGGAWEKAVFQWNLKRDNCQHRILIGRFSAAWMGVRRELHLLPAVPRTDPVGADCCRSRAPGPTQPWVCTERWLCCGTMSCPWTEGGCATSGMTVTCLCSWGSWMG